MEELRRDAVANGEEPPRRLPKSLPVFYVPAGLLRILDRDLKLAKIPKIDDAGRTIHVHGLRHTFGTHLSKAGASPRTAQAAMRHSDLGLTMNVYTDPKLLDVRGAVERLPDFPLDAVAEMCDAEESLAATGSDGDAPNPVAPLVAPDRCNAVQKHAQTRTTGRVGRSRKGTKKPREAWSFPRVFKVEPRRVELPTSALRTQRSPN